MKISRDWLSDFVDWIETDPAVIADQMTRCMGEVDDTVMQGALLNHCCVGRVQTLEKHPNADKLTVCTVQTDQGTKTVVCGGTNLKKDMLVAFAHVGATVKWHGGETMTLAKVKLRGIESEGMICAQEELDLTMFPPKPADGERPIADLSALDAKAGTPLRTALGMNDVVWHIDNHAITNRPDLFSHVGVARELVAMGLATWKKKPAMPSVKFPSTPPPFKLENDVKELVPHYYGAMIALESVGQSPDWMKRRLEAVGWRSINLVVDITNYVLSEIGMPLHAFDADDFRGTLHIRQAKKGETITTLDTQKRELPPGAVIMSDNEGVFDLFGVMGGLRTSQKPTTKHIFVQAGIIDPQSVRKTVIQMAHRTDAATVYEKGVMPVTAETGLKRAVELFLTLSPGAHVSSKMVTWGKAASAKPVKVPAKRIAEFIGAPVTPAQTKKILTDLGCTVSGTATTVAITPPAWRRDLVHQQDIIEEVARIYGYANVKSVMPEAGITPPERETRINALRDSLTGSGGIEMLHLAFSSPEQLQRWGIDPSDTVLIENPIGEEMSVMRPALIPSLLETAIRELKHTDESHLKVYEIGNVFRTNDEHKGLSFAVIARGKTTIKDEPLLMAKADIIRALKAAGYDASVRKGTVPVGFSHEGRSAEIIVQNTLVGHLFELHPAMQKELGLQGRAAVVTIGLHRLLAIAPTVLVTTPLPVFPEISFDETMPLTKGKPYAETAAKLRNIDPLLENIEIVNLYEKDDLKTLTLRFTYRAADRTLTQDEVEKVHNKVVLELKKA